MGPPGTTVVAVVEPTICEMTRGRMVVGTTVVVGGLDTAEEGGRTVWEVTVDWDGGSVLVGWDIDLDFLAPPFADVLRGTRTSTTSCRGTVSFNTMSQ